MGVPLANQKVIKVKHDLLKYSDTSRISNFYFQIETLESYF